MKKIEKYLSLIISIIFVVTMLLFFSNRNKNANNKDDRLNQNDLEKCEQKEHNTNHYNNVIYEDQIIGLHKEQK